jgi:hypothetical protein
MIKRRRRVKQTLSLIERLKIRAHEQRQLAATLADEMERELALRRAEQSEAAAELAADLAPAR